MSSHTSNRGSKASACGCRKLRGMTALSRLESAARSGRVYYLSSSHVVTVRPSSVAVFRYIWKCADMHNQFAVVRREGFDPSVSRRPRNELVSRDVARLLFPRIHGALKLERKRDSWGSHAHASADLKRFGSKLGCKFNQLAIVFLQPSVMISSFTAEPTRSFCRQCSHCDVPTGTAVI